MKSDRCVIDRLIGNQLHSEGDRPVSRNALGLGGARPEGYATPASTSTPLAREGFPPKGGTTTPQGQAHAHRSSFSQSRQRQSVVADLAPYAASKLLRPGVGVRVKTMPVPPHRCPVRMKIFIVSGVVRFKRAPSDLRTPPGLRPVVALRPPVGFGGAGAHALTRAPALSCCMGSRP